MTPEPLPLPAPARRLICDVTIPGDPKPKARPRVVYHGPHPQVYTPSSDHEKYVRDYLALVVKRPTEAPCVVEMWFRCATKRARDWDNLGKQISDSGNGVVWVDDKQIVDCHVHVEYGVGKAASTRLRVEEIR